MKLTTNTVLENSTEYGWIEFDVIAIEQLLNDYASTIECLLDELPPINWDSLPEAQSYFESEHQIDLKCMQLQYLHELKERHLDNDRLYEELSCIIEIKKLQWTCRNYLLNILKHENDGVYPLRRYNGIWVMQNKQPLTTHPDIKACIIESHIPERD